MSHSDTSHDLTTDRRTHYSVSEHYILRPDDSVSQHHIVWPEDRKKYTLVFHRTRTSTSKRQALASLRCPDVSSSVYIENNYVFRSFVRLCAGFTYNAWSPAIRFPHWDGWSDEITLISFLWRSNVTGECQKASVVDFVFWLKYGNHPVKITVTFSGNFLM